MILPLASTQQTFVLVKTSFVSVFRRRLDQDQYIPLDHMSSEDVLIKTNIFVLVIRLEDVLKVSWRRKGNIFVLGKTSSRSIIKYTIRSNHQRCSVKKSVLRNFAKFTGNVWTGFYMIGTSVVKELYKQIINPFLVNIFIFISPWNIKKTETFRYFQAV